ncbi:transposase [Micromonospora sp. NPDC051300]|uniref:transposase n=1 Tax=Micromonospora sp. NPDC051300 TaxID=3364286 RepID=UPI0037A53959
MGPLLTAELLVHTAGMTEYDSPAKLAAHAGLAPVSRDSGTISGNHRPPRRYHRRLRHILWMAVFTAARECLTSRAYNEKKRAEGKNHRQAILALARRRVDVLRALIRDRKTFIRPAPATRAAALTRLLHVGETVIPPTTPPCPPRSNGVTWRLLPLRAGRFAALL